MSETVIKVEGLGKKYIIGHQAKGGYKTFRDQIGDSFKTVFSKTKNMLSGQMLVEGDEMEEFWALKDVSFEVKQGETLGIIGRNGAGKSTLLKILSRITEPTTGKVILKGRVASLLEVGTGFHPELTGRENIFLNGAILGMSRVEIKKKFDEIVDFSGVEKFLDTPVKRYSSGMYVRLAFSVAAHLEPEILIVDEVLAVGDAEFQKKCLGRMQDATRNEGRTVLFVSHNIGMLTQLCNKGILLKEGKIVIDDNIDKVVNHYIEQNTNLVTRINKKISDAHVIQFNEIFMTNYSEEVKSEYRFDEEIVIRVEMYLPKFSESFELAMRLLDKHKRAVFTIHENLSKYYKDDPIVRLDINVPSKFLTPGIYSWMMCINHPGNELYDLHDDIASFTILETGSEFSRYDGTDYGVVFADYTVKKIEI